jgi:hypothetical protein
MFRPNVTSIKSLCSSIRMLIFSKYDINRRLLLKSKAHSERTIFEVRVFREGRAKRLLSESKAHSKRTDLEVGVFQEGGAQRLLSESKVHSERTASEVGVF